MKYLSTLFIVLCSIILVNANLYGIWDQNGEANFGQVDTSSGDVTMKLQFPSFNNWIPSNSAMNNFTSSFTFVLNYPTTNSKFLVTVNVATNKVIYFADIAPGATPYGLKYDSDVNSLKCVLAGAQNNTWMVGEMDPASASYDVYDTVQGVYISSGLSPYNHSYFFVYGSLGASSISMNSYDTRSGQLQDSVELSFPSNFIGGPFNLLYVPSMDILIGAAKFSDAANNVGDDYVQIDIATGAVKPLGVFRPQMAATIVSHAAHQDVIYANVNFAGDNLNFVALDLQTMVLTSEVEVANILSMGYFTNV
ncbi:hypothetical protein PPL_03069 [Heterostelium album PN500]|uniref:Uncharacterized protein n=1 Tax=Heterostelium pallidum (strain ATCC 26659 / Pp 5 / PN500) TaxID=670386 RepID=D3B3U8_HETP5|nr:hypothetical protein PPL_03069 [Heterostelium album PN500]EFA83996.1 hypothetical protein PPL_03069 [Heterostelium album PN500]|eukprot:XP_020436113.1 hypothetical protein PPL_03069 [Heterostelium album PN500]